MPRISKQRGEKYCRQYTQGDIETALKAIDGGLSVRRAAVPYKVPRATLQFRRSNVFSNKITFGPSPVLGIEGENVIVQWIKGSAKRGFPRRKENLVVSVKNYLDANNMQTVFTNNMPGEAWYKAFLKRHPEITERIPEGMTNASSVVAKSDLEKWFILVFNSLKDEDLHLILEDPTRIFNGDETYFQVCPKLKSVLALRGSKFVYEKDWGNAKLNLTVLFLFSADGHTTPPTIVYPYSRLPAEIGNSVADPDWGIGVTPTGWMNADAFLNHLKNVFHPWLVQNRIKLPVILFVDGHKSHISLEVSEVSAKLRIILVCLYPNATRILQPADVSAFKPMKSMWKQGVMKWRERNPAEMLTLKHMAPILKETVNKFSPKKEIIQNGFRACGLYPWNVNAIDFSRCLGDSQEKELDISQIDSCETFLTYENFKGTVGEEMLRKLSLFDPQNSPSVSEEFHKLHLLLQKFGEISTHERTDNSLGTVDPNVTQDSSNNLSSVTVQDFQIESTPILIATENINLEGDAIYHLSHAELVPEEFISGQDLCNYGRMSVASRDDIINDSTIKEGNAVEVMGSGVDEESIFETPYSNRLNGFDESSDNEILDLSCSTLIKRQKLSEFLDYPTTPKRKGKRFTEKRSYVVTSKKWKLEEMKKIEKQKIDLKSKELRKSQMLDKKKVAEKLKEAKKLMNLMKKEEKQVSLRIKQEKMDDEHQSDKENDAGKGKKAIKTKILSNIKRNKRNKSSK